MDAGIAAIIAAIIGAIITGIFTLIAARQRPSSNNPAGYHYTQTTGMQQTASGRKQRTSLFFYFILFLLVTGGGFILYNTFFAKKQIQGVIAQQPLSAQQIAAKPYSISRGNLDAKVIFVEFGDFQCPGCADFATQDEPDFKAQYVDTNQVREVWMDYPLASLHPKAMKAAEAGQCANEQGKFWQFHDVLYANQDAWVNGDEDTLWKQYAQLVGIDDNKLMQCVQANKYATQIQDAIKTGDADQVHGTPSFLINQILLFGASPDVIYSTIASEAAR